MDEFKYLGIIFNSKGIKPTNPQRLIVDPLVSIGKAPLKPQQRLHVLRTVLIPKLYHECSLGLVNVGHLVATDRKVRSYVRKWISLPHDVPIAYFHASVKDGGLGIPSLRLMAPLLRYKRLARLNDGFFSDNGIMDCFLLKELDSTSNRLRLDTHHVQSSLDAEAYFRDKLYSSVDGKNLHTASAVPQAHRWIREPTRFLTGRDFVNNLRLRIGALPSASRTSRGRPDKDRWCRAGCSCPETVNHILQSCFRRHSGRIKRHDAIIKYIERKATRQEFYVTLEPHISTNVGMRKPDMIAVRGRLAVVIDAQVNGDQTFNAWSLNHSHETKKHKYADIPEVSEYIKRAYRVSEIRFTTATLNWRGLWSSNSAEELINYGLISRQDLSCVSTQVLVGGNMCFREFTRSTMVQRHR